jgi:tetratricopeptide (TPR) repeat protein
MLALHDGLHQCVTGDMTVAIESFQRAYILYKQAGDKRSASLAQQAVGLCLDGIQKPDEVRTAYKKAIRLLHLAVMPEEAARLLSKLAHYEFSQGTIREAVRYLDAALGLYREIVNPVGQIETLCQYAALELDGGLRNQAHDHACEALGLVDRVDDVNTYEKLRDRVDRLMVA